MFDVLIDYYKEYPQLLTVTIIVLAASLVVGFIAVIAYKAVRSEKRKKQLERQAIEELNDFSGQIENDVIKIEGEEQPAAPARPTQTPTSKTEPVAQQAPNFSPADCEPKNETVSPAPEEPETKKTKGAKPTDSGDEIAAAEPPADKVVPAEPERTAKAPQKSRYTGSVT